MSTQNQYNKLLAEIKNPFGVCGLMGNLKAESGNISTNLQNTGEKKLGMTDAEYTSAVDSGKYTNFVRDGQGYGLAQWTYWSRKQNLLDFAKSAGKSIGDEDMQIAFLLKEIKGYTKVWNVLLSAKSVKEASDIVLLEYERPANQSDVMKEKRASYGMEFYNQFAKGGTTVAGYTNSPLVSVKVMSPNHSGKRTHKIDRITPHCVVGQCTAQRVGEIFLPTSRQASSNYGIGLNGEIGLYVDEANRSWCSSSNANDQRAITIECASDTTAPYAFRDVVYESLIKLCVDICRRNGLKKVLWFGDKTKSLNYEPKDGECVFTVHRWFANKSCPGDWLYNRMGDLAAKVNAQLGSGGSVTPVTPQPSTPTEFKPYVVRVTIKDLNIRSGPGTNYASKGYINPGAYTIVQESSGSGASKWGKLKSGVGWISLDYAKKI